MGETNWIGKMEARRPKRNRHSLKLIQCFVPSLGGVDVWSVGVAQGKRFKADLLLDPKVYPKKLDQRDH